MLLCRNCCLCMDLRKGCIAIGYCQAVQQILLTISTLRDLFEDIYFFKNCSQALYEESSFSLAYIKAVHIFLHTFYMILTISLLVGLHKGISRIVKDYLISASIFITTYAILYLLALNFFNEFEMDDAGAPLNLPLNMFFLMMIRYCWLKMIRKQYLANMDA